MRDKTELLKSMDTDKLVDIVKNYKQYGYEIELRELTIQILGERGVTIDQLKFSGKFENYTYNEAERLFKLYVYNSNFAYVIYFIVLIYPFLGIFINSLFTFTAIIISFYGFLLAYLIFLVRSFVAEFRFYKILNKDYKIPALGIIYAIGLPLYLIIYFILRQQMKEEMKMIS